MQRVMRTLLLAATLAWAGPLLAQSASDDRVAPADSGAAALPKGDETNAQRTKTQPGNNAPFWRGVRDSGTTAGFTSLPGAETGVLIQPFVQYPGSKLTTAGEAWRQVRNQWIIPYGGALLLIVLGAIALFYWRKGPLGGHEPDTGRKIERFTPFERSAHWANAIAFVVLAVSGVVMAFGRFFLLPVIGSTLFGWLTYALKTAHNFAGPLFAVSLLVVIVAFVRDNIPNASDVKWVLKGGGLLSEHEIPSHRYNGAEKLLFWGGVFLVGLTVVGSGLVLDKLLPNLLYTRDQMQIAHMIHAVTAIVMIAMFIGHMYIGSIGMKGALEGMRTGYVDEAWAKEHHELWYDDIRAGRIPAQRSKSAAAGVTAPQT